MDPKFFFQLGTSLLLFQAILSKGNYGSFFTPDRNYLPRPPLVPPTDPPCSSSLPEHFSLTFRLFLSMQSTWSDFQSVSLLFERTNARCTRAHKHTNKQSGKLSLAPLVKPTAFGAGQQIRHRHVFPTSGSMEWAQHTRFSGASWTVHWILPLFVGVRNWHVLASLVLLCPLMERSKQEMKSRGE